VLLDIGELNANILVIQNVQLVIKQQALVQLALQDSLDLQLVLLALQMDLPELYAIL